MAIHVQVPTRSTALTFRFQRQSLGSTLVVDGDVEGAIDDSYAKPAAFSSPG